MKNNPPILIRSGHEEDCAQILKLIKDLAEYEKSLDQVEVDEARLREDGFGEKPLFGLFVVEKGENIIGFALYYYRYSTWKGKTLYLEDLYIQPNYRQQGLGERLFKTLIQKANHENCQRMFWQVLEWNTSAISFYKKIGAHFDTQWMNGFLVEEQLRNTPIDQ